MSRKEEEEEEEVEEEETAVAKLKCTSRRCLVLSISHAQMVFIEHPARLQFPSKRVCGYWKTYYVEQKNGVRGCYRAGSCWHTVFLHSTVHVGLQTCGKQMPNWCLKRFTWRILHYFQGRLDSRPVSQVHNISTKSWIFIVSGSGMENRLDSRIKGNPNLIT